MGTNCDMVRHGPHVAVVTKREPRAIITVQFPLPDGSHPMKRLIRTACLAVLAISPVGTMAQSPPAPSAVKTQQLPAHVASRSQGQPVAGNESCASRDKSEQFLCEYFLSEIASQRGEFALAFDGMLDLARKAHDPRLARRATELAFQSRNMEQAREATELWLQLEPDSQLARQVLSRLAGVDLESTKATFARWLAEPGKAAMLFMQIPPVLARFPDKAKLDAAMQELAKPYPRLAESHFALAQVALFVADNKRALTEIDEAIRLKAGWSKAALLKAQILRESSDASAMRVLGDFLNAHDDAKDVRLAYARLLVAKKAYQQAREEFRRIDRDNLRDAVNDAEIPYAIALISQQLEDYVEADKQLKRTLELKPRDPNPVLFNLGVVAEARKEEEAALGWYRRVGEGEYFVSAKLKTATLLARRDGMATGRRFLQDAQESEDDSPEVRTQLILAESQLLRDAKAFSEAYAVLSSALDKTPDSVELLYDRAMVADKLDRLDVLESDLQQVIKLKPDYAHAYNALGYTFAERNKRLGEAQTLIQKALSLAPDDPFIQDSMGWVQFRLGNTEAALATLRKAYQSRRDPEIAAHLGEVLWVSGQREEAQKLWRAALLESPGNDSLTVLLEKYRP